MSTNTPPGWYPDPENPASQRYWDGQQWAAPSGPAPGAASYGASNYGASTAMSGDSDSIRDAIDMVKGAFWRLFGLLAIAVGTIFAFAIAGFVIVGGVARDALSGSVECGYTYSGTYECSGGSGGGSAVIAFGLIALIYGAAILMGLWVFASMVRIVRGEQLGDKVGVGQALGDTWPRAWRFIALSLAAVVGLAVFAGITAAVFNASGVLGALLGLVLLVAYIVVYVGIAGLYAWLLSPTSAER